MRNRMLASVLVLALAVVPFSLSTAACSCSSTPVVDAASGSGSGGCSSGKSGTQSCSPGAQQQNQYGRIAVQQAGPQKAVAWGIYPVKPEGTYVVTITIGGKTVDKKTQAYPPHGSVTYDPNNRRYLESGSVFMINGTLTHPDGSEEGFYFQCTLA